MTDVTELLEAANRGDRQAAAELLPLVYEELRMLAAAKMVREQPGQTLDATALVHEAYLKLVGDRGFNDRQHFFRVAAEAMRQVLVDRARRRQCERHGGGRERVGLSDVASLVDTPTEDLIALDEALTRFAEMDPQKAELVKLRYFAGISEQEAADALGISRATASRHWTFARAWLIQAMEADA
ncbi:MAG: sigma-70 family RNA polymerase sigma factor [Planctomycetaceae bacterium]|nr:sigma-70 family RNA polymerase sigma factor [Planctomycetaceae bacterium]